MSDFPKLELINIVHQDVAVLEEKGKFYGDSWKRRGGVGAFMMLARKWDRIENMCRAEGYDIFKVGAATIQNRDGIMDDIADLRRYLLLVEEHIIRADLDKVPAPRGYSTEPTTARHPMEDMSKEEATAYTNQDR